MRRLAVSLLVCALVGCGALWYSAATRSDAGSGSAAAPAAVADDASTTSSVAPTPSGTGAESPATASKQAVRVSPPAPPVTAVAEGSGDCPSSAHGAVIDRNAQRAWLCTNGLALPKFVITTAITQPLPGTYSVYAKDRVTTSTFGGHFSYLDNFVAFTRGSNTGARIAFHAVPRNAAGAPFQPLDTVGDLNRRGDSSGCIRVLPSQSIVIWDHLSIGDKVVVVN